MEKQRKDKRILIVILIAVFLLFGFSLRKSRMEQLFALVSQYVDSEEGDQSAKKLKEHKKQVEDTRILADAAFETAEKPVAEVFEEPETADGQTDREAQEEQEEQEGGEEEEFSGRFYYTYLSDSLKVVYKEVYESILSGKETEVSTLRKENLDIAFQCVLNDFPEIFYVNGYHFTEHTRAAETVKLIFSADYVMTKEEIAAAQTEIDGYVQRCFAGMGNNMSQYEQVKYIYDYIITNTEYDLNAPNNQNICSVFLEGRSVCQGYAEAMAYLLQKRGFVISVVNGFVENGNRHAWNILMVDGNYYYLDATWGDVDYQSSEGMDTGIAKEVMPVNYDYFLITTEQLQITHQINNIVSLPACVATQNNYYRKEGLYFENVDKEKLTVVFQNAKDRGDATVTIKCSDISAYGEMRAYLLDDQGIFSYIANKKKVTYYDSEQMRTLCFWLE
ncbi:MAG: hypothetical protein HDR01_14015 [Lachnospiraceae bacterium]|nr:hypothetical protein [Lachnospiraceae bacterium]